MKTSLDGGEGIGQALGLELFSYELLSGRQWTYVGDEDCAAGRCSSSGPTAMTGSSCISG